MRARRSLADDEALCDLLIGDPLGKQRQDFPLARGQVIAMPVGSSHGVSEAW